MWKHFKDKGLVNKADFELIMINVISTVDTIFYLQGIVYWLDALDQSDFSYSNSNISNAGVGMFNNKEK